MTVVVAGEALIDLIPTASGELGVYPGGGPFNSARWLARLGQSTAFLGSVATDLLGQRIRAALADSGVSLELVADTPLPTTLALAQLDAAGVARYSFYADATSVRGLSRAAVSTGLPPSLTALQIGGVALALEPSADALEHAVELADADGALVLFDPNVRPGLIADREDYMHRFTRVLARTDVLKLSVEDLAWLAPDEAREQALARLLAAGPAVVLLTDGAAGAGVHMSGSQARVPAEPVTVADTIGAGDAFDAGFLAHLLRDDPATAGAGRQARALAALADPDAVLAAAGFAVHVAGIACAQRGAAPPADLPRALSAGQRTV